MVSGDITAVNSLPRSNIRSLPFTGCKITFSGLRKSEDLKKWRRSIIELGGKYEEWLNKYVTHLVTTDWNSRKAIRARKHKRPTIMMPKWIEAVDKQPGPDYLPATHPSFLIHRLPIFHGFTLCFSQVSLEKRAMLKQKVERNGGKYSGDFNPSLVTHLILVAPEGKKYDIAKKFDSVAKVNALWFTDSIKYGIPLPEEDYPAKNLDVVNNSQCNSQNTSKRKSGDSFPNMSDFLCCKKNKSNLFNLTIPRLNPKELDTTPEKIHNTSLEKGFSSVLKDLGNLTAHNRRISTTSHKPHSNSSQIEERSEKKPRQKLTIKKIQSSQLSDKTTESLPVLWEGSA